MADPQMQVMIEELLNRIVLVRADMPYLRDANVSVEHIIRRLDFGSSWHDIEKSYPQLNSGDILAAIWYDQRQRELERDPDMAYRIVNWVIDKKFMDEYYDYKQKSVELGIYLKEEFVTDDDGWKCLRFVVSYNNADDFAGLQDFARHKLNIKFDDWIGTDLAEYMSIMQQSAREKREKASYFPYTNPEGFMSGISHADRVNREKRRKP